LDTKAACKKSPSVKHFLEQKTAMKKQAGYTEATALGDKSYGSSVTQEKH